MLRKQIVIYIIIDEMTLINYLLPIMLQAILPLFLLATVPVRMTWNLLSYGSIN